jgi:hypothetical protein
MNRHLLLLLLGAPAVAAAQQPPASYTETVTRARQLAKDQPATSWEQTTQADGADLIEFLSPDKVLVGFMHMTRLGVPQFDQLALVNATNGTTLWTYDRPSATDYSVVLTDPFILLLGTTDQVAKLAAVSADSGKGLWQYEVKAPFKLAIRDDQLLLLSRRGKGQRLEAHGFVTSPVVLVDSLFVFATDSALIGLAHESGAVRFVTRFAPDFAAGGPSFAEQVGVPDLMHVRGRTLFVSRERAGLAAYDLPAGRLRWYQPAYERPLPLIDYTAQGRYQFLLQNLALLGRAPGAPAANLSVNSTDRQSQGLLQAAEGEYRAAQARYEGTRSDAYATAGDRQAAAQRVRFAAERQLTATQVNVAMGRMQAGAELAQSMMNFASALAAQLRQVANEGLLSRVRLMMNSAFRAQQHVFQGDWYVRPFYKRGRGVTIVSLATGKRRDIVVSPTNEPFLSYCVDLPVFTVSPDGGRLMAVGISLKADRYVMRSLPLTKMPSLSILSYDLPSIALIERQRDWSILADVVQSGDTAWAKRVLDSGMVDVNARHWRAGETPLIIAAALDKPDFVRLLLARGADSRIVSDLGMTALDVAKSEPVRAALTGRPSTATAGTAGAAGTVTDRTYTHELLSLTLPAGWVVKPPPAQREAEFIVMIGHDALGASLVISGGKGLGDNLKKIMARGQQQVLAAVGGATPDANGIATQTHANEKVLIQGYKGSMVFGGRDVTLGVLVAATAVKRGGLLLQVYFPIANADPVGRAFAELVQSVR